MVRIHRLPRSAGIAPDRVKHGQGLSHVLAARDLNQDTLARRRRIRGHDHPDTLNSAHNLAHDLRALGEVQAARELDHDTLARRRILGHDHPDTLASAANLATDLRALGEADDGP